MNLDRRPIIADELADRILREIDAGYIPAKDWLVPLILDALHPPDDPFPDGSSDEKALNAFKARYPFVTPTAIRLRALIAERYPTATVEESISVDPEVCGICTESRQLMLRIRDARISGNTLDTLLVEPDSPVVWLADDIDWSDDE